MSYPKLVFRSPGAWPHPPTGATYRLRGVTTDAELATALAEGWHPTVLEAIQAAGDRAKPADRRKPLGKKTRKPGRPRGWSLGLAKPAPAPAPAPSPEPAPAPPPVEIAEDKIDDDAPPSREELEEKARELGIKFDGRTTARRLLKLITEKLGG